MNLRKFTGILLTSMGTLGVIFLMVMAFLKTDFQFIRPLSVQEMTIINLLVISVITAVIGLVLLINSKEK